MNIYSIDKYAPIEDKIDFVMQHIINCMKEFKKTRELHTVIYSIFGYDSDPRPLFDIPEVRDFCKILFNEFPFIFIFLDTDTIKWFFLCIADIKIENIKDINSKDRFGNFFSNIDIKYLDYLKKESPSTFLKADILINNRNELINKIWDYSLKFLQKMASSQEEFDKLINDFEGRLICGLPKQIK